jgi:hypothetical protein
MIYAGFWQAFCEELWIGCYFLENTREFNAYGLWAWGGPTQQGILKIAVSHFTNLESV